MGGAEFRDWMQRSGLSIRTAAERLGLSKRTIIRYSKGQTPIPEVVARLCQLVEGNSEMAYSKLIPMQKRRAMGETITGSKKDAEGAPMKKGGKVHPYHGKGMKKGGKTC